MLIGAAVFARPVAPISPLAALAGGLAPDLPMFAMILWSTRILGVPEHEIFGEKYYSDAWQAVFAIDHSFLVWGALLAFALLRGRAVLRAFAGSGLLHALADFLTHHDDARCQLWPTGSSAARSVTGMRAIPALSSQCSRQDWWSLWPHTCAGAAGASGKGLSFFSSPH